MALGTLSPRLTVRPPRPHTGGGNRPPVNRSRGGGGGGGGRGGDGNPDYGERLRRYRLGMAIGLLSIVMLFVTFSLAYIFRQKIGVYDPSAGFVVKEWTPVALPMRLLWINTALLVLSSIAIERARRQAARDSVLAPVYSIPGIKADGRRLPWLTITMILGFLFLGGQALAWRELGRKGYVLGEGAASSFFYVLTGTHALHLVGGMLALSYALFITLRRRPIEQRRIIIDVTSWYWHVIDVLWLYLFALLALAR